MSSSRNTNNSDITLESLSEYLKNRFDDHREYHDFSHLLKPLVCELCNSDFSTIDDVHKALKRTKKAAELFEADYPGSQLVGNRYSAIGIVIISMALLRGSDFFTFRTVVDNCSPEKLEEYRKHILTETDEPQATEDQKELAR